MSLDGSSSSTGRRPKYRQQTKGADPRTGYKQRAPTQEPALVKVKRVLPWCPGLFLSGLGLPFVCAGFFFGLGLLGLLLCPCVFWLVLAVGVAFQLPGGRDVGSVFFSFSVDGHRPEYRLFQVSLYVCPSGVPLRARARLSCLFNGFLLLHQCGHRSLCQRALLSLPQRAQRFLYLVWCCRRWPYAHAPCHRSCLTVRSTRLPPS